MSVLRAQNSRFAINNTVGDQFLFFNFELSGTQVFDASTYHFVTTANGGLGHGIYEGTGFVTAGVAPLFIPVSGDVTSLSVDFLGGNSPDYRLTGFSVDLSAIWGYNLGDFQAALFSGADDMRGSAFGDTLDGFGGNDFILGLGGADTLFGGSGNDRLDGGTGDDDMYGGADNDIYIVDSAGDSVTEYAAEGTDRVISGISYVLGANVENLTLLASAGDADGTGNNLNNRILGNRSDNILTGLDGIDTLISFAGNDTLYGGNGNDILSAGNGVDYLYGEGDNDILIGGGGGDFIYGGDGYDRIIGGSGADWIEGGDDPDTIRGGTGGDNIYGGEGNDRLFGDDQNDNIYGGIGNDLISGGTGADYMAGGQGNDVYRVDQTDDEIFEASGEGADIVLSTATYTLSNNVENLRLLGGAGAADGTGNNGDNRIWGNNDANILNGEGGNDRLIGAGGADELNGGAGVDFLDGGTGDDIMRGGADNDVFVLRDAGDSIVELLGEGTDTVLSHISTTLSDNVEVLRLLNSAGVSAGTGNGLNNTIRGNDFDNLLYGVDGNDILSGGAGADLLIGGNDNDHMTGGTGVDTFGFETGDGNDIIADYTQFTDRIAFTGLTYGDLTISAQSGGMLIEYGAGDSISLLGTGALVLTAADFDFF